MALISFSNNFIQKQPLLLLIENRFIIRIDATNNSKTTFVTVNPACIPKDSIANCKFKNNLCYC